MVHKGMFAKLAGGLVAVGVIASALVVPASPVSADCGNPPCIDPLSPSAQMLAQSLRPDLTVTNLIATRIDANTVKFSFNVKNNGLMPAKAGSWSVLYINYTSEKVFSEGQIAPGASVQHEYTAYLPVSSSGYTVSAQVDANNDVTERFEDNNFVTRPFN